MTKLPKHPTSLSILAAVPNPAFNPNRLTVARKRRGRTKGSLASEVDVDLRAITAFEAGEYPPSEDTLQRIANALLFPSEFFFGDNIEEPPTESVSFRALTRRKASHRDMATSQGALAVHLNEWLEKKFNLPQSDLPDLGRETKPENAGDSLRRYWKIGELSIRNMVHLLEAHGVRVFSLTVDARDIDAFSMWRDTTPFVFLNMNKTAEHSRFDAAHELGHLVLHKHGAPNGRTAENEANAFASAFLMPRASVIAKAPRFPTFQDLVKAKKNWKTSVAALNYRMHSVGMLSDWQYRTLCIDIATRGRENEPEEIPRELSQVLPAVFAALYQDGVSRSDVARELAIPQSELEQLMFGLTMTGIDGGRQQATGTPMSRKLKLVK